MDKKAKWKNFFKFFGIGAAIAVGIVGLVCAYLGITGGFRKKVVYPTGITFDINKDNYQTDSEATMPVFVIQGDDEFTVLPDPEDTTELDATLLIQSGDRLIKDILVKNKDKETMQENEYVSAEKVGTNKYRIFLTESFKIQLVDGYETLSYRTIIMHVDSDQSKCDAKIFVDSKLKSFDLKYEKIGGTEASKDNFFPGDSLYITIDKESVDPLNALDPNSICTMTSIFKSFNFRIDNENIATFEKEGDNIKYYYDEDGYPKVKLLLSSTNTGKFKVSCEIWDSYLDYALNHLTEEEYDNLPTDDDRAKYDAMVYGGEYDGEIYEGFVKTSEIEITSQDIEVDNITARVDTINVDLFGNYTFVATNADANGLNIKINPKNIAGSHYTSDDLKYYLNNISVDGAIYVGENDDHDAVCYDYQNGNTIAKYIKKTDRYIQVHKDINGQGEIVYKLNIVDYRKSNCLLISLSYEIVSIEDGLEKKEEKILYTFVNVEMNELNLPDFDIKLADNSNEISLYIDKQQETQTDVYDLSTSSLVISGSSTTLEQSNSTYKKTLFVTVDSENNFVFSNDVIEIQNAVLSADKNAKTIITPKDKGNTSIYAIMLKTDANGNYVDNENNIISPDDYANILALCVIPNKSTPLNVVVNQQLKIAPTNTVELYYKEGDSYNAIEEDNDLYVVTKNADGQPIAVTMYANYSLYVKLNVNDSDAFYDALNDTLTFTTDGNKGLISVAQQATKYKTTHNNQDFDNNYLIKVEALRTETDGSTERLIITYKNHVIFSLSVTTKTFTLEKLTMYVGESVENRNGEAYLVLSSQDDKMFWTTDSGKSQEKQLEIKVNISPSKAVDFDEVVFEIYTLLDDSIDITSQEITKQFIDSYLKVCDDVLKADGIYTTDKDNVISQKYNILKAGKVVVIAHCTRNTDNKEIYSNAVVIDAQYPNIEVSNFNYGDVSNQQQKDGLTYRQLVTSYDKQLTNLLDFVGIETKATLDGGEGVEGNKFAINWSWSTEGNMYLLYPSLYNFEIAEILDNDDVKKEDFKFVQKSVNGQIINYLQSPVVHKTTYIKIKISTKFGYEFEETYNYVLLPDMVATTELTKLEMNNTDTKQLFAVKFENNEFVNNGGELFLVSNKKSNYKVDNTDKLTGFDGKVIKVIYLPNVMDIDNIVGLKGADGNFVDNIQVVDLTTEDKYLGLFKIYQVTLEDGSIVELRFTLNILKGNDPNNYVTIGMNDETNSYDISFRDNTKDFADTIFINSGNLNESDNYYEEQVYSFELKVNKA